MLSSSIQSDDAPFKAADLSFHSGTSGREGAKMAPAGMLAKWKFKRASSNLRFGGRRCKRVLVLSCASSTNAASGFSSGLIRQ